MGIELFFEANFTQMLSPAMKLRKITLNFKAKTLSAPSGAPDVILARLPEFFRLFLSDGLLSNLVYALGLKNV